MKKQPSIGLALGSGASRGWSHIGVIDALVAEGIEPDIVCGTSVGAMVGASYVAGNLEKLREWVLASSRADVYRFFDIKFSQSGFVDVDRLGKFIHEYVADKTLEIDDLDKPFLAVSTCLNTGHTGQLFHHARHAMSFLVNNIRCMLARRIITGGTIDEGLCKPGYRCQWCLEVV